MDEANILILYQKIIHTALKIAGIIFCFVSRDAGQELVVGRRACRI
jgi:hypothetical protein